MSTCGSLAWAGAIRRHEPSKVGRIIRGINPAPKYSLAILYIERLPLIKELFMKKPQYEKLGKYEEH
jgi:hypothetical protein